MVVSESAYDVKYDINKDGALTISDVYIWDKIFERPQLTKFTDYGIPAFANGGIADQASIFGEAGPEAAVPLPDGRSIPVTLRHADNYSNNDAALKKLELLMAECVAELKGIKTHAAAGVKVGISGFTQLTEQGTEANKNSAIIARSSRLQTLK
jgi:hypothetical protein